MLTQTITFFTSFPHICQYRSHFFIISILSYWNNSCEKCFEHYNALNLSLPITLMQDHTYLLVDKIKKSVTSKHSIKLTRHNVQFCFSLCNSFRELRKASKQQVNNAIQS